MKIAYLVNQYPHVSHSFIRREIVALEEQGVTVKRFTIRPPPQPLVDPADRAEGLRTQVLLETGFRGLAAALVWEGVRAPGRWLRALGLAVRIGWRSGRGVARHLAYLAEACVLVRRLRGVQARHLHAHFGTNSATVALLARVLGGPPYSFTVHGPEEFDRPEGLSLPAKIDGAAFVVAVSDFGRSQLLRWCPPEQWPKIHVIRCGVDEAFLKSGPQAVPDTRRLVCVGRLADQKGQLALLEALARLHAQGVTFDMVLAGDGPMRPALEERVRRLGLENQVRITGWLSNAAVREEILAARALVLSSFAEGLPVVLMEALALGRPVVSTYLAGIPELVESGVSGWLVPAGSVTALTAALAEVLGTSVERLTHMGRAGALRVAAVHDAGREAARLASLLQAVSKPWRAGGVSPLF